MPAFVSENTITIKQGEVLNIFVSGKEQTQKAAHGVHAQQGCMCNKGIFKRMTKTAKAQNTPAHAPHHQLLLQLLFNLF